MSDQQYETFQHYGTNAARLAFTPAPAAGIQPIYVWYATDTGLTWLYDTSWHQIAGAGATVPTTTQGDILYASGTNTLAALAKNASATRYLSNTGTSNNPAWAQVNAANGLTGVVPVANGGTGSASGAAILKATKTLTNAEIKALPSTPITLIAAPTAGSRIKVIGLSYSVVFTAAAYTNVNATYAALFTYYLGDPTQWAVTGVVNDSVGSFTRLTTFLSAANATWDVAPYLDAPGNQWTQPIGIGHGSTNGVALALAIDNNGSGALTGGNAANSLLVTIYYTVESLT